MAYFLGNPEDAPDISYLGEFEAIHKIWTNYPTGGCKGQHCTVKGEHYDWDEYHNRWTNGHDSDLEGTIPPENQYEGDFNITGNLECNNVTARTNVEVNYNLNVKDLAKTRLLEVTAEAKANKLIPRETILTKDASIHSESYFPGLQGFSISGDGTIEAKSLRLREFLEVPELRKNRISVSGSEAWITDAGIIENVEKTDEGFAITLRHENGVACEFQPGDLLKGVYHQGTGFNTIYLEVTNTWSDGTGFDCFLPQGGCWPEPHMTLARIGNSVRADRQGSIQLNGHGRFIRILDGVGSPDFKLDNIKAQFGNINGIATPGFGTLQGFGAYLTNVYASGRFVQRSGDGVTESPLPVWRGDYDDLKVYYYYDLVIYQGSNYLCTRNTQYPGVTPDTPAFWQLYTSKGQDGKDAVSIEVEYSGDREHWHTGFRYDDLYMRQRLTDGYWSEAIRIVGEQGPDGKYMDYRFAPSAIPEDKPDIAPTEVNPGENWTDSPPEAPYIWMTCARLTKKTVLGNPEFDFADPDNARWSDPVKITGDKGAQGDKGIPGIRGTDGTQYFTWLKYADDAEGNGMIDTPEGKKYMGIAVNQTESLESTDPGVYKWSKIEGDKGIPGTPGENGKILYTWIKYADDKYGSGMSDTPDGKLYIGIAYNQETEQEGTDPKVYSWVLFKGDKGDPGAQGLQGEQGLQGIQGPKGLDGLTTYFHIKYSAVAKPTTAAQMTETPDDYIGTYVDTTPEDSDTPQTYSWSRFKGIQGENGANGIPGTNGTNGQTSYLHIKYSDDGITFTPAVGSTPIGETPGAWIGQYTDFTLADSTVFSSYAWTKIKGDQGIPGINGADGVNGNDGVSIIFKGQYPSHPANPQNGWSYYNTTDRKSYVHQSGVWYQMTMDGVAGANGADGLSIVYKGDLSEAPANPQTNWAYRDTDNHRVYIYNGTAWVLMVADGNDGPQGATGADGLSVFITYHDQIDRPTAPTGQGNQNGWHTNGSASARWMSQKVARAADQGTWGPAILIKGADGATGPAGAAGATIRMRGEWDSGVTYVSNTQWRDVVLYNKAYYIVRPGLTVQNSVTPDRDTTRWEQFNEFENLATKVLLAGQGNIDVLGAGELFVGQTKNGAGWKMTGGKIAHTTSGLSLTADGRIEVPAGRLTIAGKIVGDAANRNLLPGSDGSLCTLPWIPANSVKNGVFRLENNTPLENYLISPRVKLKASTTYTIAFSYRSSNIISGEIMILPSDYNVEGRPLTEALADTSQWTGKTYTFTTPSTLVNECVVRFDNNGTSNVNLPSWIEVTNIMLVEGSVAGSWSRAPEDMAALISDNAWAGVNLMLHSNTSDESKPPRSRFTTALIESNAVRSIGSNRHYTLSPANTTQNIGFFHQWGGWQGGKMPVAPYADFYTLSFEYYFDAKPITSATSKLACLANLGKLADSSDLTTLNSVELDYTPGIWHRMVLTMDLRPYKEWFTAEGFYFYIRLCSLSTRFYNNFGLSFRNIKLETGQVATPWRPDDENYYLREALAGNTTVDGGLVTTSIIKLGSATDEKAGISGVGNEPTSVRAWFGGSYQDALSDPSKVGCIFNNDGSGQLAKGNIKWNNMGDMEIKGKVEATSGTIGGFDISGTSIKADRLGETRLTLDSQDIPLKSALSTMTDINHSLTLYAKIVGKYANDNYQWITSNKVNWSETWNGFELDIGQYPSFMIDGYSDITGVQAGKSIQMATSWDTQAEMKIPPNKWGFDTTGVGTEDSFTVSLLDPDGEVVFTSNQRSVLINLITKKEGTYRLAITGQSKVLGEWIREDAFSATLKTTITFPSVVTEKSIISKTLIGTNGLTSIWGTDNYMYYSKDDGFEVKKGDHSLIVDSKGMEMKKGNHSLIVNSAGMEMKKGTNALIVDSGGVKVKNADGVMPVNPIICGGTVKESGDPRSQTGYLKYSSGINNGVVNIIHNFGSTNYMVLATLEAIDPKCQDNTITVASKGSNSFFIKIKSPDGTNEFCDFSFMMFKTTPQ